LDLNEDQAQQEVIFSEVYRFPYALPRNSIDTKNLRCLEKHGIFFAGDYIKGKGRVILAIESGIDVATHIMEQLTLPKL